MLCAIIVCLPDRSPNRTLLVYTQSKQEKREQGHSKRRLLVGGCDTLSHVVIHWMRQTGIIYETCGGGRTVYCYVVYGYKHKHLIPPPPPLTFHMSLQHVPAASDALTQPYLGPSNLSHNHVAGRSSCF